MARRGGRPKRPEEQMAELFDGLYRRVGNQLLEALGAQVERGVGEVVRRLQAGEPLDLRAALGPGASEALDRAVRETADDPYAVFGLRAGAPDAAVRAAYRELARQTHPDHGGRNEDFLRVQAAYERIKRLRGWSQ